MSLPDLTTGTIFAGYQIDGVAGEGGMGVVYRATEIALQRPVALKLIADDFAGDRKFRERFQRESMLAASIDHPNVIPVYEAGEVDGELYIAMRFVDGTDLLQFVTRQGALPPHRAVRIVAQVAAALDAAHRRGLVHRDVKPGNVLISGEGEEEHAYLTDFGLVKTLEGARGTTTAGHFVGTLDYSSPEAIQGQDADARSDVYSLACVLFFALTRTSPFLRDSNVGTMFAHVNEPPPSLLEADPKLPPALAAVIEQSLAKDPAERHQSAGELARAAQEALTQPAPPSRPSAPAQKKQQQQDGPPRRNRALGIVLASVLGLGILLAGLAAAGVFSGGDATPTPQATPTATATKTAAATATATPTATAKANNTPKVAASIDAGDGPDGISVTDDGTVFVTDATAGAFVRIDPKTNKRIGEPVKVGSQPDGVTGGKGVAWIASSGDDQVRRIESNPDPVVVAKIPVGKEPNGISLGKQLVWVTNTKDDSVNRIDRASATLVGSPIGVGDEPIGVFVGSSVWVANHGDDTVTRIDPSTSEVVGDPIPVGKGPRGVTEAFGSAWVANSEDGTVSRIDARTGKVQGEPIRVGRDPREVTAGKGFIWTANSSDNTVSQIDPKTNRVVGRAIPVGDDPIGIAFGAGSVWTANHRDGTVTRIDV